MWCSPCVALAVFVAAAGQLDTVPQEPVLSEALLDDADLTSVFLTSGALGWAVGQRGAVWHTRDRGVTWHRQESGVTSPLDAVSFVDERTGWIVGGETFPGVPVTRAIVLRTGDGGRHWRPLPATLLPRLRSTFWFDQRNGLSVGTGSALFPSGVFQTVDGGRTWSSLFGRQRTDWSFLHVVDPTRAWLIGLRGQWGLVDQQTVRPLTPWPQEGPLPRGMHALGQRRLFVYGDAGLAVRSDDQGRSWQPALTPAISQTARQFDFTCSAQVSSHIWLAGTPGTAVFHSPDGGSTWELQATGQALPLDGIHFVSAQQGCAVGSLGLIVTTQNGGRSWTVRRGGGRRAAWVALAAGESSFDWEIAAQLSLADGFRGRILLLTDSRGGRDLSIPDATWDRLYPAAARLGAGVEPIVCPEIPDTNLRLPAERIVQLWNARGGRAAGLDRVREQLTRQLRIWRPDIVLVGSLEPRGDGLDQLITDLAVQAIGAAARSDAYALQTQLAGLRPWKVRDLFLVLPAGQPADVQLVSFRQCPSTGRTVAQLADDARASVWSSSFGRHTLEPMIAIRRQAAAVEAPRATASTLLPGDQHPRDGATRRAAAKPASDRASSDPRQLKYRMLRAFLMRIDQLDAASIEKLLRLAGELAPRDRPATLALLARRLQDSRWHRRSPAVYAQIVRLHADHPLAAAAQWELFEQAASEEWLLARAAGSAAPAVNPGPATAGQPPTSGRLQPPPAALPHALPPPRFSEQKASFTVPGHMADVQQGVPYWAASLAKRYPDLFREPSTQFALAAFHRRTGQPSKAQALYRQHLDHADTDWQSRAREELRWLVAVPTPEPQTETKRDGTHNPFNQSNHETPPIRLPQPSVANLNTNQTAYWSCRRADAPPRLDGRLNDAVWEQADVVPVMTAEPGSDALPTSILVAYDDHYLYAAAVCQRAVTADYAESTDPRTRDADLTSGDRLQLFLDVDRDYQTYWQLTMDYRGWTADALGLWDKVWDPAWQVASVIDPHQWSVEAAIPLNELAIDPVRPGTVWSAGVRRIIPQMGAQHWHASQPFQNRPHQFGYLVFR